MIFGSTAIRHWYPEFRKPKDKDWIQQTPGPKEKGVEYLWAPTFQEIIDRNEHPLYLDPDMLFIRSVDLILTEKCSLKCKDCANLMQYYENPINIESEELIGDLHDICSIADEINEIRIIGGEPLMNKQFHEISLKFVISF